MEVRTINIFSSVTMPEEAGKMFIELKSHRDVDVMKYTVGELAKDMADDDDSDDSEMAGPLEMDKWLISLGARHGETVIIHHGRFDWDFKRHG